MKDRDTCRTCRFRWRLPLGTPAIDQCRRWPPAIVVSATAVAAPVTIHDLAYRFPQVMLDDWCGEHRPHDLGG